MIYINYLNRFDFEYDLQGIIRSFFPGEDLKTVMNEKITEGLVLECDFSDEMMKLRLIFNGNVEGENDFCPETGSDKEYCRKETKNTLKRKLYDLLRDYTNKELLWGTLSGIRPTKITSALLEAGMDKEAAAIHMKENYYLSDEKTKESITISENELRILKDIDYKNGYS